MYGIVSEGRSGRSAGVEVLGSFCVWFQEVRVSSLGC